MDSAWLVLLSLGLGLAVGAGFVWILHIAARRGDHAAAVSNPAVPDGVDQLWLEAEPQMLVQVWPIGGSHDFLGSTDLASDETADVVRVGFGPVTGAMQRCDKARHEIWPVLGKALVHSQHARRAGIDADFWIRMEPELDHGMRGNEVGDGNAAGCRRKGDR